MPQITSADSADYIASAEGQSLCVVQVTGSCAELSMHETYVVPYVWRRKRERAGVLCKKCRGEMDSAVYAAAYRS
jgi:hypothetical protein